MAKMDIKIYLTLFLCIVICPVWESNAVGVSKHQKDEVPCDTCPRKGKCVPKVSCPAHVRHGSHNPECHLKEGQIGICCFTGRKHAAKSDFDSKSRESKNNDYKKKAHNGSKSKWRKHKEMLKYVREHSNNTVVRSDSPDYGHQLSLFGVDKYTEKLGEGALLNLFATEDLRERQAIDDDELALEYGDKYDGPYCPPQPTCPPPGGYRSVSGDCNNPHHPTWGAANTGYERLLPPAYSDGVWLLRTSKCGGPLASPRTISRVMLLDGNYPNSKLNVMNMQYSQFIAHDVSQAVMHSMGNGTFISCCTKDGDFLPPEQLHFACAPIAVDPDDEFFSSFEKSCLNFVRAQLAPSPDCSCGYAKQMNGATHLPDLSQLYGNNKPKQDSLRAPGGYMKVFNDYGRELPPLTDRPECLNTKEQGPCFDSGDHHGNQLITLTVLHTIFTREHNRLVEELTRLNPGCSDDEYFYGAKRILVAMYQHINMNEWLPLLIGPELMETFDLVPCEGYSEGYDPDVNPSVLTEFAAAAMRFGHSTVVGKIEVKYPHNGEVYEKVDVSELMFQPSRLRRRPFLDRQLFGMITQPMQCVDPFLTFGLTRYMFRGGNPFGLDLASLNIQRGRDFGNQPYNQYRQLCGLKPYKDFDEFPPSARDRLSSVYACPNDIDLWIGGLLEKPVDGGIVGPTFAHIIAEQFSRFKKGDSYYYEYGPDVNPEAFTPSQLAEIKKASMHRILCDNLDYIELSSMSPLPFIRADFPGNAPIQCDDTTVPSMDLSRFKIM